MAYLKLNECIEDETKVTSFETSQLSNESHQINFEVLDTYITLASKD